MAKHNELGRRGEELAVEYLNKKGYGILDRNWKYGNFEIDIIVRNKDTIVFVEVKTRSDNSFMQPWEAVTIRKQSNITIAANHYVKIHRINLNYRFDVISIIMNSNNTVDIEHIEDAFQPIYLPRKKRY